MAHTNYHMHTWFCDGKEEPVKYVEQAIQLGVESIGFSAHAPMPFYCNWALPGEKLNDYYATVLALKEKFSNIIQIYCGLEIDYIPQEWVHTQAILAQKKWDYIIGSIHFVDSFPDGTYWTIDGGNEEFRKGLREIFNNNHEEVVRRYFTYTREMVERMKPQVIGHIDKIKMQYGTDCLIPDTHPVFREEIIHTLDVIAKAGSIVEINTRGVYRRGEPEFYPGLDTINEMFKRNIPVTINSDAHRPEEVVMLWEQAAQLLKNAGYRSVKTIQKGVWTDSLL